MEDDVIEIQSRSISDPTLSGIDFKNKMTLVWTIPGHFNKRCSRKGGNYPSAILSSSFIASSSLNGS